MDVQFHDHLQKLAAALDQGYWQLANAGQVFNCPEPTAPANIVGYKLENATLTLELEAKKRITSIYHRLHNKIIC